ncbi:hypothetical protein AP08_03990 [Mycobacterium tuberculosis M2278]|nr:hypothetical protein AP08_03990 [Mycobacterium tuberculosis M2278]
MCAVAVSAPRPVSSDPKPREGTETRHRHDGGAALDAVVRPKTPRGDGNSITLFLSVARLRVSSDPKPREGTETFLTTCAGLAGLGRQTQNPERGRKHHPTQAPKSMTSRRQTQNPERGRKHDVRACSMPSPFLSRQTQNPERGRKRVKPPPASPGPPRSSDPKPREGTETGQRSTPALVDFRVVRPKTPRGDGNRAAFDTRSS